MPDNVQLNAGSGGDILSADEIGGVQHQRVKVQVGADGSASDVEINNPIPAILADPEMGTVPHISHFGALKVSPTIPIIKANFPGSSLDTTIWTQTLANGGTVTVEDGVGKLNTSTATNGSSKLLSVKQGIFEAGQVTVYQSGVMAGVPVVDNIRRWGLMTADEQNGLFFELNGNDFNVVSRRDGTDTRIESAGFNGDTSFTPGATNNTYRIHYSVGRAIFSRASAGKHIKLHTLVDTQLPLVTDLNMGLFYENTNSGNGTDVELRVRGASSSVLGHLSTVRAGDTFDDDAVLNKTASVIFGRDPSGTYAAKKSTGTIAISTTPLADGATWNSGILDSKGYGAVAYIIYADQPFGFSGSTYTDSGGVTTLEDFDVTVPLNIENNTVARDVTIIVPRTRYFDLQITNNSGSAMTKFYAEVRLLAEPPGPTQLSLSTPLRDGTAAGVTKAVLAGRDDTGTYRNAPSNRSGALLTAEYVTEAAIGRISNVSYVDKFGRNSDIDVGDEDVWEGGGTYTGLPTGSPETVELFSSDANDTAAGTGARTVRITGLLTSSSTAYTTEDITLNGTTPVTSVSSYYRVNRVQVLTAGGGGENAGTITCRHSTTTGNVFASVQAGANQSQVAAYTIPAGKIGVVTHFDCRMSRSTGSVGSANVTFRVRPTGGVFNARRNFEITNQTVYTTSNLILNAGDDIKVRVESVSDTNTIVTADIEILLIDA